MGKIYRIKVFRLLENCIVKPLSSYKKFFWKSLPYRKGRHYNATGGRDVFRTQSNIYNEAFFAKIVNGSIADVRLGFKYATAMDQMVNFHF